MNVIAPSVADEGRVLAALRERLMTPEVYAGFVRGFTAEWNAEQKGLAVAQEGQPDELKRLDRKIGNLVGVISDSGGSPAILSALKDAEARKAALEAELAVAEALAPRLMPNLAELYRERVTVLQEALVHRRIQKVHLLNAPSRCTGSDFGGPTDANG